jgi:hypothetical protein
MRRVFLDTLVLDLLDRANGAEWDGLLAQLEADLSTIKSIKSRLPA